MKVLMVASEMFPLAKTGGLADVVGALSKSLKSLGCDVRVVLPYYREVKDYLEQHQMVARELFDHIVIEHGGQEYSASVLVVETAEGVPVYLVRQDDFYMRSALYGSVEREYSDNGLRFSFFCRAVLYLIGRMDWRPDVIHCHDWQAALVPLFTRLRWGKGGPKTVFTIHNLSYHGLFPVRQIRNLGIPPHLYSIDGVEFYGQVSFLKAGLIYSNALTTVSRTYAQEIQTPEFGHGLEGLLTKRSHRLVGIVNGVDYSFWTPEDNPHVAYPYGADTVERKKENKALVRARCGWTHPTEKPLLAMVCRIVEHKGFPLVIAAMDQMMKMGFELVVVGSGDVKFHLALELIEKRYSGIRTFLKYDSEFAPQLYAGADMLLMPSSFEPCGLTQLIAMHFGTVPIVHATGGLKDTVLPWSEETPNGSGFVLPSYDVEGLMVALKQAKKLYEMPDRWRQLQQQMMTLDFSWSQAAKQYWSLYSNVL